jgi:hypothetical protein
MGETRGAGEGARRSRRANTRGGRRRSRRPASGTPARRSGAEGGQARGRTKRGAGQGGGAGGRGRKEGGLGSSSRARTRTRKKNKKPKQHTNTLLWLGFLLCVRVGSCCCCLTARDGVADELLLRLRPLGSWSLGLDAWERSLNKCVVGRRSNLLQKSKQLDRFPNTCLDPATGSVEKWRGALFW